MSIIEQAVWVKSYLWSKLRVPAQKTGSYKGLKKKKKIESDL